MQTSDWPLLSLWLRKYKYLTRHNRFMGPRTATASRTIELEPVNLFEGMRKEDVAKLMLQRFPELAKDLGRHWDSFCAGLAEMSRFHGQKRIDYFAAALEKNLPAIDNYVASIIGRMDKQSKERDWAGLRVTQEDVYVITASAVIAANLLGINPARIIAIAEKESKFVINSTHQNPNGTIDCGPFQINLAPIITLSGGMNAKTDYEGDPNYWLARINRRIPKGMKLLGFPKEIYTMDNAYNPVLSAWAAAITLTEKRTFENRKTGNQLTIDEAMGAYNGKSASYGKEVYDRSEKIKFGFHFFGVYDTGEATPKPTMKKK